MPITRRKRANPPDQPEDNNTNPVADQSENSAEVSASDQSAATPIAPETTMEHSTETAPTSKVENGPGQNQPAAPRSENGPSQNAPASPQSENGPNQNQQADPRAESGPNQNQPVRPAASITPPSQPALPPSLALAISERAERLERGDRSEYSHIEGGRRTARGELFRRPPQPPPVTPSLPPVAPAGVPPLQPPSHEIKLPLGKEPGDTHGDPLHLAYNPGYTGADGARTALLQHLTNESKAGGRARCWNCGSLAIVYDRWNTRSKTFGEIGIAFCEICGVWSVM